MNDTVVQSGLNNRAEDERQRLLAGLETFANADDSEEEYRKLQLQIPGFWPINLLGPGPNGLDQQLEWPLGGRYLFLAFRDYLRRVWRSDFRKDDGSTLDGVYLEYLLGLEIGFAAHELGKFVDARMPTQAFREGWAALLMKHEGAYCAGRSQVLPQWGTSKFEFIATNDFQNSVYLLMTESWRAKVCRRCGRYFIADKAAQMFCSTDCSNQNKLEIGRRYWHEKGAPRREARASEPKRSAPQQPVSNDKESKKGQPK